ncbi:MAG: hypothetical protein AAFN78_07265 [Pseudomonadota bacterium]
MTIQFYERLKKGSFRTIQVATMLAAIAATPSHAALSNYLENFEDLDQMGPDSLGDAGWLVGANVFSPDGSTFLYNYFAFPAPNGGPAFSGIDVGQGGPDQGEQQLVVYNDYNNIDHQDGLLIQANVYQEQIVGAGDVGTEWIFSFDAKEGNIEGASTAAAFIRTVDQNNGFEVTSFTAVDMTNIGELWGRYALSLLIDPSFDGQLLQFGFLNTASNYEGSGIFYDNLAFQAVPVPAAVWLFGSAILGLAALRRRG